MTFKINLTSKSKFTPFWVCPCHNSSPFQARTTKFEPEVQNTLVKIPIVFWVDWAWHVRFNFFSKSCLCASLLCLSNICETCINIWKGSLFHILNGCAQICLPTASCHRPGNSRVVSLVWPLLADHGPRLSDWQWIFNASVGFRDIIHTSHAKILYANIR